MVTVEHGGTICETFSVRRFSHRKMFTDSGYLVVIGYYYADYEPEVSKRLFVSDLVRDAEFLLPGRDLCGNAIVYGDFYDTVKGPCFLHIVYDTTESVDKTRCIAVATRDNKYAIEVGAFLLGCDESCIDFKVSLPVFNI